MNVVEFCFWSRNFFYDEHFCVLYVKDYFDVSRREMINNELKWDIFAACLPAFLSGREMSFFVRGWELKWELAMKRKFGLEFGLKQESSGDVYF
jgi:hypothetical protein